MYKEIHKFSAFLIKNVKNLDSGLYRVILEATKILVYKEVHEFSELNKIALENR